MRRALLVFVLVVAPAVHAQSDPEAERSQLARWYAQVDNDFFFNTDRWYSSGVRIARLVSDGATASEWALVQEIWSPEGKRFAPGVVDRAPTARLQLRRAWHVEDENLLQTTEIGLGVRGRGAGGEAVTSAVHHVFSAAAVDWSREVASELDASLTLSRTQRFGALAVHYGGVLGNEITYVHGGLELRTGSGSVYSPVLRHAATPPFELRHPSTRGTDGFIGVSVRAVARNELLDLPYEAGGEAPRAKPWVARAAIGVASTQAWGSVALALVHESREFAQQRVAHDWGSIMLHLPF